MDDPVWIDRQALLLLHGISIAEFGGAAGLRDEGLFDSALARPKNLAAYGAPDIVALAAAYGFGIARNHPFVDGNKRVAFLAIGLFLEANGLDLHVDQLDAIETILALAAGDTDWLRSHAVPRAG